MLLAGGTAHAGDPTVHATHAGTVSYSDNILAAPDNPPPNQTEVGPPAQDVLLQYAPGVAIHYLTSRVRFSAAYAHPFIFYVRHPGADTSADIVQSKALFSLSRFDELEVGFDLARYTSNTSTLRASDETAIMAQRGDDSTLIAMANKQQYTRELSEEWSLLESGDLGLSIPVDGGSSLLASSVELGPQLALRDHAFALLPSFAYTRPLLDRPIEETGYAASDQVLVGGRARWHWIFAPPEWALALTGGAVAALDGADTDVEPVGGAAMRFSDRGYAVSLVYDRGFVPNLITGQTYFTDRVALTGALPLSREHDVRVSTSTGVALSRVIDAPREVDTGRVRTFIGDAAIGWYPELYPHIELRYQHTRQWDAPPDQVVLPDFRRNVVSLQVSFMWPPLVSTLPKGHTRKPEEKDEPFEPIE